MATKLRLGPSTLIGLAAELQDEGLIEVFEVSTGNAGRPKKGMRVTALGMEYLRAYETLSLKLLKSRRADLRRAAEDGGYARRLAPARRHQMGHGDAEKEKKGQDWVSRSLARLPGGLRCDKAEQARQGRQGREGRKERPRAPSRLPRLEVLGEAGKQGRGSCFAL